MRQLFTISFLCWTVISFAQTAYKAEEFQASLMQSKTGAMLVYTGDKHSFTIDIVGEITPSENPGFVTVENKIIQFIIIPFQTKIDFENLSEEDQMNNLLGFYNYEMSYINEQLKSKNLNEKYEFLTLNGKEFLSWTYDMPKSYKTVKKQCYLATICFDHMLVINAPVDNGKSFAEIKDLLTTFGETLQLNNHTIDLEKLFIDLN